MFCNDYRTANETESLDRSYKHGGLQWVRVALHIFKSLTFVWKKKKRHTHNMDNVCQTMELGLVQERDNKIGKENNVLLHENI